MPDEKKEQFETEEEIKVELPLPDSDPVEIITTERGTPIKRHLTPPLKETHGMTTEAGRFRSS